MNSSSSPSSAPPPLCLSAGVESGDEGEGADERGKNQLHAGVHRRHHLFQRHDEFRDRARFEL